MGQFWGRHYDKILAAGFHVTNKYGLERRGKGGGGGGGGITIHTHHNTVQLNIIEYNTIQCDTILYDTIRYIEDSRWREDMNFMFEWQEQYLNAYCSCHSNIKFISSSQRVMFFSLYGETKLKAGIVTSLNDTTLTKVTYEKYATRVPDEVAYGIYERFSSQ